MPQQHKELPLRNRNYPVALFLLPAFFVPKEINEQAFEHRLYLPI